MPTPLFLLMPRRCRRSGAAIARGSHVLPDGAVLLLDMLVYAYWRNDARMRRCLRAD